MNSDFLQQNVAKLPNTSDGLPSSCPLEPECVQLRFAPLLPRPSALNLAPMKTLLLLATTAATAIAAPPEPKFTAQDIDRAVKIGYGVAIADVDGDKLTDILLADARQIRWYKNPGKRGAEWPRYVIAEELTKNDNVCIAAQDIDGDGKCEVAIGAEWNPGDTEKSGAVFYLIPPADRTQKWEPVKFPSVEPTTHRMKWVKIGEKEWGLAVLPLHGRGNKNGEGESVRIAVYFKPINPRSEWFALTLSTGMHLTHNFNVNLGMLGNGLTIVGKEGRAVILINSERFDEINIATLAARIPKIIAAESSSGISEIRSGTLLKNPNKRAVNSGYGFGGNSRLSFDTTIEPMHGNSLVAYFTEGPLPNRRVLTDKLVQGHALACGDILGVGGDQIIVGWRGNVPPKEGDSVGLAVWTALDDNGEKWRETVIDKETACEDLAVADLDADGKLDIVAAGRATHNLRILWNDR